MLALFYYISYIFAIKKNKIMNKERYQYYLAKIAELNFSLGYYRKRNRLFLVLELSFFSISVGFLCCYATIYTSLFLLLISIFTFCAYLLARYFDSKNSIQIKNLESLLTVYKNEQKYLSGDFTVFGDGKEYIDHNHPFSLDVDLFGSDSLFNRINRTVTSGGSDYLARCLSSVNHYISGRDKLIRQLAEQEIFRTSFVAKGVEHHIDTDAVVTAIEQVRHLKLPLFSQSRHRYVAAHISLLLFYISIILSFFSFFPYQLLIVWGLVHLGISVGCSLSSIRQITKVITHLRYSLDTYISLVSLISKKELRQMSDSSVDFLDIDESVRSFDALEKILNRLDKRGNILGLLLTNIFSFSDFFLLYHFSLWRDKELENISIWVDKISILDACISMATYCYNHPSCTDAEIVDIDGVLYQAKDLYHPFLDGSAVSNDFTIENQHCYIITGANMAGKSTFLRAVAINYILAMNGMPVFAAQLRVSSFDLFTSMRTTDDLAHGISYFNAELLRLQQLISNCKKNQHTLIILDEILKGTNSLDKLNGSLLFLKEIGRLPVTAVIATHDLELSKLEQDNPAKYQNYCFEIELTSDITYNYRLTRGIAKNQNATFLLKKIICNIDLSQ